MNQQLSEARRKAEAGGRLSLGDAMALYEENDLLFLAHCASLAKERHSGKEVYYTINRHINLTNVCTSCCPLCAFGVPEGDARGFCMDEEQLDRRIKAFREVKDLAEVHIVSALHPDRPYSYYKKAVEKIHAGLPRAAIQAFTPVEIVHFAKITGRPVSSILSELQDAGLTGLPGGGAEIFASRVRKIICPEKATAEEWLAVMREAAHHGIRANASMMYGHIETTEERFEHLLAIRDLQDECHPFDAFLLFPFHPLHTKLGEEYHLRRTGSWEDLKMLALSRLILDNVPHFKAFWVMLTLPIAQLALGFGADDLDGTIGEEKIIHAAGAKGASGITEQELAAIIQEAGYHPVKRDAGYHPMRGEREACS